MLMPLTAHSTYIKESKAQSSGDGKLVMGEESRRLQTPLEKATMDLPRRITGLPTS
jgi:hypothetical protein